MMHWKIITGKKDAPEMLHTSSTPQVMEIIIFLWYIHAPLDRCCTSHQQERRRSLWPSMQIPAPSTTSCTYSIGFHIPLIFKMILYAIVPPFVLFASGSQGRHHFRRSPCFSGVPSSLTCFFLRKIWFFRSAIRSSSADCDHVWEG